MSNNLYLRGKALTRVESLRFLGIIVHEHLSWKPHMELLLQKIRINSAVVRRIQHYLNQKILLLLYNSVVKSHLQYCILTRDVEAPIFQPLLLPLLLPPPSLPLPPLPLPPLLPKFIIIFLANNMNKMH